MRHHQADALVKAIDQLGRLRGSKRGLGTLRVCRTQVQGFLGKYELGDRLAAGAQGVTWRATERATGRKVVVKKPNNVTDTSDFDQLVGKTHPNIVRVFELFHNPLETYVVMELCVGGDLFSATRQMVGLTQNWCAAVFQQALRGVKYLHEQFRQAHNDLKPENILLDRVPRDATDVPRAMIGDFGCCGQEPGDPRYRSPELWRGSRRLDPTTDAWALGVTLFELVSGGLLIYVYRRNVSGYAAFLDLDRGATVQQFMYAARSASSVDVDGETWAHPGAPALAPRGIPCRRCKALLRGLLEVDPRRRFTIDMAIQHPWFELAQELRQGVPLEGAAKTLHSRGNCSALRVALLNVIGSHLQGASIEYYRTLWSQYDVDHDGTMSFEEFEDMLRHAGLIGAHSQAWRALPYNAALPVSQLPTADELFELADVDMNGKISFQEFVGFMFNPDELDEKEKLEYFKSAFHTLAGDDHGISAGEFASLFADQYAGTIYELFREIDTDNSGHVDYQEFEDFINGL